MVVFSVHQKDISVEVEKGVSAHILAQGMPNEDAPTTLIFLGTALTPPLSSLIRFDESPFESEPCHNATFSLDSDGPYYGPYCK